MTFDPRTAVYTPPEVSQYGLAAVKNIKANQHRALSIGMAEIRDYYAPLMPGQLSAVIAQTSNYKSGFLHFLEKVAAAQLIAQGRTDEVLVHISVEEIIEEQSFLLLSRESGERAGKLARGQVQDWSRLQEAAIRVGTIPIYRIGESLARAEDFPHLTITNMIRSIMALAKGEVTGKKMKIAGLFFDYLQAFPLDTEVKQAQMDKQRRLQVRQDIYRLRQIAAHFKCPVWVAVQAKQTLSGSSGQFMMPGIYDGEESSAIGQRSDRIVQLWMPKMNHPVGSIVRHNGASFLVKDDLIFLKVGKQRGNLPSGKTWECKIDFETNTIAPQTD
jgi:hypothetical protein